MASVRDTNLKLYKATAKMAFFKEESEFQFQFLSRLFFFVRVFRVLIILFRVLMTKKKRPPPKVCCWC